jgi:hypothetical protein
MIGEARYSYPHQLTYYYISFPVAREKWNVTAIALVNPIVHEQRLINPIEPSE